MNNDLSVNYDDLLFSMQQRNLVYNYNFLNYSNKTVNTAVTYNHPDGWVYNDAGTGGLIGFDPTTNSCMIRTSTGNSLMTFTQTINEFPRWNDLLLGKRVSACAVITVPGVSACELTFSITDGLSSNSQSIYFNSGEKKEINVALDVNQQATTLMLSIECSASQVVLYISKVYANVGNIALENLPCIVQGMIGERKQYVSTEFPSATELSLCNQSIELSSSYTRLNSFLNGKFGRGGSGNSLLPDMRGYFSRAWDNGAKTDPDAANRTALGQGTTTGDNVGTVEQDQFKEHIHQLQFDLSGQIPSGTAPALPSINKAVTSNTGKVGGNETRSKNIAELYTIKWA
jgi:microcystin-dependent protein